MPARVAPQSVVTAQHEIDAQISFEDGVNYWNSVPASVNGVLGGYGEQTSVPKADIVGSSTFMRKLKPRLSCEAGKEKLGMEFGAGIGRVTRDFLHKLCDKVDLIEPVKQFVDQAKVELQELQSQGKVGDIYNIGIQDWSVEDPKYSDKKGQYYLLWCQWCIGHLTDEQFLKWLDECKEFLQKDGLLVIKENNNTSSDDIDLFDPEDSSKTRSDKNFRTLFKKANWKLISTDLQKGVPKELLPIRMYALKPIRD